MTPDFFQTYLPRIQHYLDQLLRNPEPSLSPLIPAMRYSLLNGGKRLRALLVYATGTALDADLNLCDIAAASVELIHAFSLIHDDLPAMDDDVLRRGIPTCHIAFDEATAILAGDALHTEAFDLISHHIKDPQIAIELIQTLSRAIGQQGMVQGQTIDVMSENKELNLEKLTQMHFLKTGCLIQAAVKMGFLISPKNNLKILNNLNLLKALDQYSHALGIAFQIKDDLLDATSDSKTLGKTAGLDLINKKSTFVSLLGIKEAQIKLEQQINIAKQALSCFPEFNSSELMNLAKYVMERES